MTPNTIQSFASVNEATMEVSMNVTGPFLSPFSAFKT